MNPNDPESGSGDVLSQTEVERLLSEVQAEPASTTVVQAAGTKTRFKLEAIQPFDFRQPTFLTPTELRRIRLRHEGFLRSLGARLSVFLRQEVVAQMSKLQTVSYQKFIDDLANPTHVTLFKADPLRGICLLDVPPPLGLTIVDSLLGGQTHSATPSRNLSEIETALLDQALQVVLNEWCCMWDQRDDLRPVVLGHENDARFLQTAPHDTVLLALSMEVRLGDCSDSMQLAFPYYTIEPLIRQLSQTGDPTSQQSAPEPTGQLRWYPQLGEARIPITATWSGLELSTRELSGLKCGDVLMLDPNWPTQVEVRLAHRPKFRGRLGTRGHKWAVELVELLPD